MIISGVVASASRPVPVITTGAATNTTVVPTVTTLLATNYNQNSATLNGSTSVGTLSFLWGTTSNPTTPLAYQSLTGLNHSTAYYYRAVGTNNDVRINIAGTLTTTTQITVSVEWGTASGVYSNTTVIGTYNNVNNQSVSVTLNAGLVVGTTYYYRLIATNYLGTVYGNESSFTANNVVVNGTVRAFATYTWNTREITSVGAGTWTPPSTSGAPIDTVYNLVLIGGGASGAGGSGQGRLITSYNFGGGTVSYALGGSNQSTTFKDQTAIAGVNPSGFSLGGSSGDGFANGAWSSYYSYYDGYQYIAIGGGGGASGPGSAGYLANYVTPVGGSGGPAATLSWTRLDGTAQSYAYGGGGAGVGEKQNPVTNYVNAGSPGGYGGAWNGNGVANRGGGGGYLGQGGSGYIYFEYWGPEPIAGL